MHWRYAAVLTPFPYNDRQISLGDIFCLIAPSLLFLETVILGRVYATEIAFAAVLPILLSKRAYAMRKNTFKVFTTLCFFWLLSQIFTDIIMRTVFEDWSRGWAKIIFFYANFLTIYLLICEKPYRAIYITAGIAIGLGLRYFFMPTENTIEYPWKFGVGSSITTALVLIASWRLLGTSIRTRLILIFIATGLNFYFEFRSLGVICLFTGFFYAIAEYAKHKRARGASISSAKLAFFIITTILLTTVAYSGYSYALKSGWFSEESELKFSQQAEGDYGTILGGRSEILISVQAIADSPIIGYGSWAKSPELAELYLLQLRTKGYVFTGELQSDLIQTHSHIFGAWVEAGLFGGILWIWVLWISTTTFLKIIYRVNPVQPIYLYIILSHLWAVLFSPLNGEVRIYTALSMAVLIVLVEFYSAQQKTQISSYSRSKAVIQN
jgi:hypothetical protein